MTVAVVLFTRDLRVCDNPTLHAAAGEAEQVVPLFVLDPGITGSSFPGPNRAHFLAGTLRDLNAALRRCGSDGLVVRRGELAEQVAAVAAEADAETVHISADYSAYARTRARRLAERLARDGRMLRVHEDTVAAVPPGRVLPSGGDHFAVFTPYHRRWEAQPLRPVLDAPGSLPCPPMPTPPMPASRLPSSGLPSSGLPSSGLPSSGLPSSGLPSAAEICAGPCAPELPEPGESAARARLQAWLASGVGDYADRHDDLAGDATSRISPYLHFGCLSPVEVITRAAAAGSRSSGGRSSGGPSAGAQAFIRQVAWRDFHLQVLAARPQSARRDYRDRGDRWRHAGSDLQAWRDGRTGVPIVDAAMRQLLREGWMHNRGRLIVGSFLTKHLYIDWRAGAAHFLTHLLDGDVANNQLNWQWVAGTGTDTRPNRVLNPIRQAHRYDPDGVYVRRFVPELAGVDGAAVHEPWALPAEARAGLDYPEPLVDLAEGRRRFLDARAGAR